MLENLYVSTHSRLKAAGSIWMFQILHDVVSTHSRLKAAGVIFGWFAPESMSFNTQPPEGGWVGPNLHCLASAVSTHSRLKAAGYWLLLTMTRIQGFNTQPPEGGWESGHITGAERACFNTQPPEGGWIISQTNNDIFITVSTHSRLKAAGEIWNALCHYTDVSTHSRLKAAGLIRVMLSQKILFQHTAA